MILPNIKFKMMMKNITIDNLNKKKIIIFLYAKFIKVKKFNISAKRKKLIFVMIVFMKLILIINNKQ